MLLLKPGCECCDKDLPPDAADARICSFECTFCADCPPPWTTLHLGARMAVNSREVAL